MKPNQYCVNSQHSLPQFIAENPDKMSIHMTFFYYFCTKQHLVVSKKGSQNLYLVWEIMTHSVRFLLLLHALKYHVFFMLLFFLTTLVF